MFKVKGYAAYNSDDPLSPFTFWRRNPGPLDVQIKIYYCGICHTDLHQVRNSWNNAIYPMVPGHEIVGKVIRVGSEVTKFVPGEIVGVGCMVNSCRVCISCCDNLEQYCELGATLTYNSRDPNDGGITYGGYSEQIVVDEHFVVKIPSSLDIKAVAPLLCAGITTYSPLKHWRVGKADRVGIIGVGGLGHLGIKFSKALGANVVMITSSKDKAKDAKRLGADEILYSNDFAAMKKQKGGFDFLLNTIPDRHDINPYIHLLKRDKTMVFVGNLSNFEPPLLGLNMIDGRKRLAGSDTGGMLETQEMMNFCAVHNIVSDIEVIPLRSVNSALDRLAANNIRYRCVLEITEA